MHNRIIGLKHQKPNRPKLPVLQAHSLALPAILRSYKNVSHGLLFPADNKRCDVRAKRDNNVRYGEKSLSWARLANSLCRSLCAGLLKMAVELTSTDVNGGFEKGQIYGGEACMCSSPARSAYLPTQHLRPFFVTKHRRNRGKRDCAIA
ncbi:hypothetical protein NL676_011323 [Syzygium grande]|nr:hypothetical protein NL676_011323 [Syzygium grande]